MMNRKREPAGSAKAAPSPVHSSKELEFENEKARERENFRNRGFFNGLLIPFYQVPNFR
jgi:hypothetical protein